MEGAEASPEDLASAAVELECMLLLLPPPPSAGMSRCRGVEVSRSAQLLAQFMLALSLRMQVDDSPWPNQTVEGIVM